MKKETKPFFSLRSAVNNLRIYDLYNENLTKDVFCEKSKKVIGEVMK